MSTSNQSPLDWIRKREIACDACESQSINGICNKCKDIHPDRDCIVAIGIQMKKSHCPIGRWEKQD